MKKISYKKLRKLVEDILLSYKLPLSQAKCVSEILVFAELSNHASHGVSRLLRIIQGINAKTHNLKSKPVTVKNQRAAALVDGRHGLGYPVASYASNLAISKAKKYGVSVVGVYNTNHCGMLSFYSRKIASCGLVGMVFCNTEPAMGAPGAKSKTLGTNPLTISVPYQGSDLISLDMATSVISRGVIFEAMRCKQNIPGYAAVNHHGVVTRDPHEALKGFLLPFGGEVAYKGFGLAMMIDILSGALTNAACGLKVKGSATTTEVCTVGNLFIAIDISSLVGIKAFKAKVKGLVRDIKASGENIYYPGEKENLMIKKRKKEGIPLDQNLYEQLLKSRAD